MANDKKVFTFTAIFNVLLMLTGCSLVPFGLGNLASSDVQNNANNTSYAHYGVDPEWDRGCDDAERGSYDKEKHSQNYKDGYQTCAQNRASLQEHNDPAIAKDGTPDELRDLINNDHIGMQVDEELTRRGYKKIHTDIAEHNVWTYWKKHSTLECIVLHINEQHVITSITRSPDDC